MQLWTFGPLSLLILPMVVEAGILGLIRRRSVPGAGLARRAKGLVLSPVRGFFGESSSSDEDESWNGNSSSSSREVEVLDVPQLEMVHDVGEAMAALEHSGGSFVSGIKDRLKETVRPIYPGTKWCGGGDKSRSYTDLGKLAETDSCCRAHDLCDDSILAGETKYSLSNTGLFTKSHCSCDKALYQCLKHVDSYSSRGIGYAYFSILGPRCFRKDYPITGCKVKERGRCVAYNYDTKSEPIYQWFDTPKF